MRYPVTWRLLLIALATVVVGQVTVDVDVTSLCRRPSRSSVALNNATWDVLLSGESAGQNTTVMVGVTVMEAFSKGFVTLGLGNRTIVTYNLCGLTQCPLRANSNISLSMVR
ncbi:hypothetical protein BC829DRAFT_299323 [Chytridium lagenaria]|nr:hypothetical protein BC829DRAFT_299323 [Chytridium lagenaria]